MKYGQRRVTMLEVLRLAKSPKMRQREVASKMGVSVGFISTLESGSVNASEESLRAYAKALGSPLGEVKRRFWATRLAYCQDVAREARQRLREVEKAS